MTKPRRGAEDASRTGRTEIKDHAEWCGRNARRPSRRVPQMRIISATERDGAERLRSLPHLTVMAEATQELSETDQVIRKSDHATVPRRRMLAAIAEKFRAGVLNQNQPQHDAATRSGRPTMQRRNILKSSCPDATGVFLPSATALGAGYGEAKFLDDPAVPST